MSYIPRPQEIYKHFKGNLYQILTVAEHTETGEDLVVYQAMYGDKVDKDKYPNASQEYRFELQKKEEGSAKTIHPSPDERKAQQKVTVAGEVPVAGQAQVAEQAEAAEQVRVAEHATLQKAVEEDLVPSGQEKEEQTEAGMDQVDPLLLEYLDADSYEDKLNILAALHHKITQDMITTMAVAGDIEVGDGDLEERYNQLKNCLITMEKYECSRIR